MKILGIPQADFVTGIQCEDREEQGNHMQCHWDSLQFLASAIIGGQYPTKEDVVAIFKVSFVKQNIPLPRPAATALYFSPLILAKRQSAG